MVCKTASVYMLPKQKNVNGNFSCCICESMKGGQLLRPLLLTEKLQVGCLCDIIWFL